MYKIMEDFMQKMILKSYMLMVVLSLSIIASSCAGSTETKKADAAASATATVAIPAKPVIDREALVAKVKDTYVCPKINISIAEADEEGALCPEGKKMLEMVDGMVNGTISEGEILNLVQNYAIQGRSLVQSNGQPVCTLDSKVKLEFFIMSYCPYGVRFVDQTFNEMKSDLGDTLDWKPRYILGDDGTGKLQSLHGQKEVDEDLRQICIRDKWGNAKWSSYMDCFSKEIYSKERTGDAKTWEYCAEQAEIVPAELKICFDTEAVQLAQEDLRLSQMYRAQGSPTAVYNCSKNIVGAVPYQQIKKQVCKLIPGTQPATCVN